MRPAGGHHAAWAASWRQTHRAGFASHGDGCSDDFLPQESPQRGRNPTEAAGLAGRAGGPAPASMPCCGHPEILTSFERGPTSPFRTRSHQLCNWLCTESRQNMHSIERRFLRLHDPYRSLFKLFYSFLLRLFPLRGHKLREGGTLSVLFIF